MEVVGKYATKLKSELTKLKKTIQVLQSEKNELESENNELKRKQAQETKKVEPDDEEVTLNVARKKSKSIAKTLTTSSKKPKISSPQPQTLLGTKVAKFFSGQAYPGIVISPPTCKWGAKSGAPWWKIVFEDGDREDWDEVEVEEGKEVCIKYFKNNKNK
ncbi:hypothetical protein TrST_g11256 [Triparma strigata]|uniref:Uncharacterized protein n=1 Tax=Triparma strigata TaxID=1606541 RepID=A0A9W7BUT4_9STRA|nr:hypothetical protein TrST_g11256 [Triparma strigata]